MGGVRFGEVKASAGEAARGRWKALELSDGSWAEFPVFIANGRQDGPIVYLGGAIHGDEYNGIGVIQRVIRELDPTSMRGAVIAVPIQNPIAHRSRGRLTLIVQTDETNMHRVWPGDEAGDSSQRMAGLLFSAMCEAGVSVALDYHSGAGGQVCAPHAFVPAGDDASRAAADRAFELARHLDLGVVMRATGGAYSNTRWMEHALARSGVAAVGLELGQGRLFQDEFIDQGTEATLRLLRHLGVVDGPQREPGHQRVLVDERWVRAERGGFVTATAAWGTNVAEGELIGRTVDAFGEVVEELESPVAGYLMNLRREPAIATGERLCRIGVDA